MSEQQQQPQHQRSNVIHVAHRNKPLRFYVGLTKKLLTEFPEVELTALGIAMVTVVQVVEMLKKNDFCAVDRMETSSITLPSQMDGAADRNKPKLHVFMVKGPRFDELRAEEDRRNAERRQQQEQEQEQEQEQQE